MWKLSNSSRYPTLQEKNVITDLQEDLLRRFQPDLHDRLLERLWNALTPSSSNQQLIDSILLQQNQYARISNNWVQLGFQRDDPAIDFRGGGQLALQCMVYFAEMYRTKALTTLAENKYSWAIAGVNLCVQLIQMLKIVPLHCSNKSLDQQLGKRKYWHLFESKAGFYELFVLGFMNLHSICEEMNATEMNFNSVLLATGKKICSLLSQSRISNGGQFTCEVISLKASSIVSKRWLENEKDNSSKIIPELDTVWSIEEIRLLETIVVNTTYKVLNIEERNSWEVSKSDTILPIDICDETWYTTPPISPCKEQNQDFSNSKDNVKKTSRIKMAKMLSTVNLQLNAMPLSKLMLKKRKSSCKFPSQKVKE